MNTAISNALKLIFCVNHVIVQYKRFDLFFVIIPHSLHVLLLLYVDNVLYNEIIIIGFTPAGQTVTTNVAIDYQPLLHHWTFNLFVIEYFDHYYHAVINIQNDESVKQRLPNNMKQSQYNLQSLEVSNKTNSHKK